MLRMDNLYNSNTSPKYEGGKVTDKLRVRKSKLCKQSSILVFVYVEAILV